jgi:hypothetical protein
MKPVEIRTREKRMGVYTRAFAFRFSDGRGFLWRKVVTANAG